MESLDGIGAEHLGGFFVGWPDPPSPDTHLRMLRASDAVVLAVDEESGMVAGFVTAISDGVLAAYIPLLEVLPAYQRRGIGAELVRRMLAGFSSLYMVDLLCDDGLRPLYEAAGMHASGAMMVRNYVKQSGR